MKRPVITLIGAGHAAWHLGQQFCQSGFSIRQVFSRGLEKAASLAESVNAEAVTDLENVDAAADLYLIAVRDDAIAAVAERLAGRPGLTGKLVVHVSGATPLTVLTPFFSRCGVFYPLQTFSTGRPVIFEQIPVCIDALHKADLAQLQDLAKKINAKVYLINDQQRAVLHVAAVFANNFSNHLYQVAADILDAHQLPFDLLRPLILETAAKVQDQLPQAAQTGPAVRGDQVTIQRHLRLLEDQPEYRRLYAVLTRSINNDLKINE